MTAAADFPSTPASIAAARRFVARQLAEIQGLGSDDLDEVTLMVSELATNSVRHAGTPYRVAVHQIGDCVRIEVSDAGGGQARLRTPGPRDPHGRGLQIVSALADAWGVDDGTSSPGKTTWFTYRVKAPRSDAADRRPF
jgi:anti-sigma regulatory factor (Ser/Thr protein kinase)